MSLLVTRRGESLKARHSLMGNLQAVQEIHPRGVPVADEVVALHISKVEGQARHISQITMR